MRRQTQTLATACIALLSACLLVVAEPAHSVGGLDMSGTLLCMWGR